MLHLLRNGAEKDPLKKSAGGKSPKSRALKVSSAAAVAKKFAAARLSKLPTGNVTVSSQVETINLDKDNEDNGKGSESQTLLCPYGDNEDNEGFQQFTGRRNRRKKKEKEERQQKEEEKIKQKEDSQSKR